MLAGKVLTVSLADQHQNQFLFPELPLGYRVSPTRHAKCSVLVPATLHFTGTRGTFISKRVYICQPSGGLAYCIMHSKKNFKIGKVDFIK